MWFGLFCLFEIWRIFNFIWFEVRPNKTPVSSRHSHINRTLLIVHLKYSKTDQQGEGIDLWVGRSYNDLCPVSSMLTYLVQKGNSEGLLLNFMYQDGKSLSRESFIQWLKKTLVAAGIDPSKFSGLSFRMPVWQWQEVRKTPQFKPLGGGRVTVINAIFVSHAMSWQVFQGRYQFE